MAESADDDTAVRDGDLETTVVPDVAPTQAAELAWSASEPTELELPRSWRPAIRAAVGVFAACVVVAGGIIAWDRYSQPPPVPAAATGAKPTPAPEKPPAWHLNGTYRIDVNNPEAVTYHGDGTKEIGSDSRTPARSSWAAFRTDCETAGCTAHAVILDDVTHQNAVLDESGHKSDRPLRWSGTDWESAEGGTHGGHNVSLECDTTSGADTMEIWTTLSPMPDGSFRGTYHGLVMTNECGTRPGSSLKLEVPLTAVRIGDAPPGVFK